MRICWRGGRTAHSFFSSFFLPLCFPFLPLLYLRSPRMSACLPACYLAYVCECVTALQVMLNEPPPLLLLLLLLLRRRSPTTQFNYNLQLAEIPRLPFSVVLRFVAVGRREIYQSSQSSRGGKKLLLQFCAVYFPPLSPVAREFSKGLLFVLIAGAERIVIQV